MALTKTLRFDEDVLQALKEMEWASDGLSARITSQLDRPLYEKLMKALKPMSGKWIKQSKMHVFDYDPRSMVEGLLESGSLVVEKDGFFETPEIIVRIMIDKADISKNMSVLEPSAGKGAIAKLLKQKTDSLFLIEKNVDRATLLQLEGYSVWIGDFLQYDPECSLPYKRIVMNPPFEEAQDQAHVMKAYNLLAKDGRLVAIMGEHAFFAEDKKSMEFRAWLQIMGAVVEKLSEGSFKSSGTGVNARIVVINCQPEKKVKVKK